MFDELRKELARLLADDVQLQSDERRNCVKSSLVKVTIGNRSCSVIASGLLRMLQSLPDGEGESGIQAAIETRSRRAEAWMII
jgi:hypothetical protein